MARVLHISRHERMDRRITGEMNHLVHAGHDVAFLSTPVDLTGAGLSERIRLAVLRMTDGGVGISSGSARFRQLVRRGLLCLPRAVSVPVYARALASTDKSVCRLLDGLLAERLRDFAPDVIHVHDLRLVRYAMELKRRHPSARVVYDAHELTPFQVVNRAVETYLLEREREAVRQVDAVITVNEGIAERMRQLYGIARPHVVLNSVEPSGRRICVPPSHEGVNVIFQGSLTRGRNLERLARAFRILPPDFRLTVLGDGPLLGRLRRMASGNVVFRDAVPQTELLEMTAKADFGIIPYLGDTCENNRLCTPNKLFEYIEAGLPVCSSDLPEVARILSACGNGQCFPMRSEEEIAAAVRTMADALSSGRFDVAAREAARARFSHDAQMKVLERACGL